MIRRSRLANGTRVVSERMPDAHSVTIGFWVGAGSRHEDPAIAGASHFLEHLLFKGTAERSAREIAEAVDAVGGEMNAFTTKEYTAYYVRILDESLDLALDILSDVVWAPAFRPDEVDCERQVILEEIRMHEDTPDELVHSLFAEALFPGQTVGREVLGERDAIVAMTRDEIAGFHHHHYRAGNVVVAAAGNVDHERLVDGIAARFTGGLGDREPRPEAEIRPAGAVRVLHRPTEQAHLMMGMRGLSRHDDRRFALSVLSTALGGGASSRLFQEIRENRGLVYSIYSFVSHYAATGTFGVYAGCQPGKADEVLAIVADQLADIVAKGLTDDEIARGKGQIRGGMVLGMEDAESRMSRLGKSELSYGETMDLDELLGRVDAVTSEAVQEVAAAVLTRPTCLGVVGPFAEHDFDSVIVE